MGPLCLVPLSLDHTKCAFSLSSLLIGRSSGGKTHIHFHFFLSSSYPPLFLLPSPPSLKFPPWELNSSLELQDFSRIKTREANGSNLLKIWKLLLMIPRALFLSNTSRIQAGQGGKLEDFHFHKN